MSLHHKNHQQFDAYQRALRETWPIEQSQSIDSTLSKSVDTPRAPDQVLSSGFERIIDRVLSRFSSLFASNSDPTVGESRLNASPTT